MSEENTEPAATAEEKKRDPKRNSIPSIEVQALVDGIPSYEKASFLVVGHKDGVRLAVPRTAGVSRVYFYANGDYSIIPDDEAITVFSESERKDGHKGGIMAEVNFEKGLDAARRALGKLVEAVKAAPAPVVKPKTIPKVKAPKAEADKTEG